MDDYIDISKFYILPHCRKRWKKRWLDFTPIRERRIRRIDDAIKFPMKIIRRYPDRGTMRVTDFRYEYVIDTHKEVIITVNAHVKRTDIKEFRRKKERLRRDGI